MRFTESQLSKWANDYEKEIVANNNFICDRLSLAIISGLGEYELPNYITNIRMVLYKGKEIHPKGFAASMITNDTPFNTTGGIPYEYIISGKGLRVIKFYPTPNENVSEYVPSAPEDLFSMNADTNGVIIEFYRTSNVNNKLPDWIRRYLLKDYVCWRAFKAEGPNLDLRAATYYEEKMKLNAKYVEQIKTNMFQSYVNILNPNNLRNKARIGRPVLPPNFGVPTY